MLGALSLAADPYNPYDAFVQIGTQLGARMHPLHAPTVLRSRHARDALVADPSVKSVLDLARSADYAICGIGTAGDDSTFFQLGYLTATSSTRSRVAGRGRRHPGAVHRRRGAPVPWSYGDMLVSLDLSELKRIPQVIAVAAGPAKVRPILGALRGGYLAHLVTDADTVRSLLALGDEVAHAMIPFQGGHACTGRWTSTPSSTTCATTGGERERLDT
jgi:DNA-binding transcriptional regulator LsrR (DeoR family)